MPPGDVIPELAYADVRVASEWLCRAFGFVERLRIGKHRAQLVFGAGSVVVTVAPASEGVAGPHRLHGIMVRVSDVDRHWQQAAQAGAQIVAPPANFLYGERQYSAVDPGGHRWTFSQTLADVDPATWGGTALP